MIVRRAELSDIPAVAALERAEFPDGADEGMLARLWETDGGVILIAEEGGDLLGYVWARFVLDEGDIGNVAVAGLSPPRDRRGAPESAFCRKRAARRCRFTARGAREQSRRAAAL